MGRIRAYWRLIVVTLNFLPIFLSYARDRRSFVVFGSSREITNEIRENRAKRIRKTLLNLGPTFIKLGQVLSSRPDVLPPEYTDVLSTLQDDVPPASWSSVEDQIESELGGDTDDIFDDFNREAISGASLGQVYTASVNDQRVAVKVRRPNIRNQVEADVQVLKWLTPVLMRFVGEGRAFSLKTLADEFSETLIEEMDYQRERDELEVIRSNFEDDDMVVIPDTVDSLCSEKILTMEYVEGVKIDNVEKIDEIGVDRDKLAERLQQAYFDMIIEHGVFHADPHPGNLAVKPDGSVIFYDFGMTGRIDQETRDKIVDFYANVATDNASRALDALVDLGIIDPNADRDLMIDVLQLAIEDAQGMDVDQRRVEDIFERVEDQLYEFPFRLPPNFSLLLRVATIANGVCLTLNPDIDFISVITDMLKERGYIRDSAERVVRNNLDRLQKSLQNISTLPNRADQALEKINNGEIEASISLQNRELFRSLARQVVKSVLVSGLLISATILYTFVGEIEALFVLGVASILMASLVVTRVKNP